LGPGADSIQLIARIEHTFDPLKIMNPCKVLRS
jgi:FAD/FMN-containing dehydrogenase